MKRVFGLETGYGITLSGAETVDVVAESIELVRRYTDHGALMKWDMTSKTRISTPADFAPGNYFRTPTNRLTTRSTNVARLASRK